MAELLVKAKKHWMDDFTQAQIDELSAGQKESFLARSQIGDIVVVRPDGWEWGREECLPNFVVIKLPGVSIEEAKVYEQNLTGEKEEEKEIEISTEDWNDDKKKEDFLKEHRFKEEPKVQKAENKIIKGNLKEFTTVKGTVIRPVMLKHRKHAFDKAYIQSHIDSNTSVVTISEQDKDTIKNSIKVKTE
jgi:hypothetical protein